ncbi:MAG: PKD domain-containing protein, partial [Bacteroidaceae bacterium]|nr:PKD domain-containing protein [Bacteroidaceae bacterium]
AFPVVTSPVWKAKKGVISSAEGNDTEGSAVVSYKNGGDYTVTLTLENSLGSDARTFQVIKVEGVESGVESPVAEQIATYVVEGAAFVEFAREGNYKVAIYTLDGKSVARKSVSVAAGENAQITLGAEGVYLLTVESEGKILRSVKLLNK